MAKLEYNEIKERKYIIYKDEPFEVLESHVARTQQRKPQNQVKMRNLINGKVIPATFHSTETADEADVTKREAKFIYASKGEFWFTDPKDPKNRFTVDENIIGDKAKFLKGDTIVELQIFEYEDEETVIGLKLPIKMTFEVKDAPPAIKGNTASGGGKLVTLETGAQVTTPFFIEVGEKIVVNTETGEYVERVK
ncbi:MAG: efp, elongation factor elongation factor [Candidatus Nomurabacteria bacterium]|nr:efp, elongation factor elongation factor [Candidatus Nomurabacteria bacterium]